MGMMRAVGFTAVEVIDKVEAGPPMDTRRHAAHLQCPHHGPQTNAGRLTAGRALSLPLDASPPPLQMSKSRISRSFAMGSHWIAQPLGQMVDA